jgi:hypothetical protein
LQPFVIADNAIMLIPRAIISNGSETFREALSPFIASVVACAASKTVIVPDAIEYIPIMFFIDITPQGMP